MIEENPIPQKVALHRKLKRQKDAIEAEMNAVKAELRPLVEALDEQKWSDDEGYARMITRRPSVSFQSNPVDALMKAWIKSTDDIMQSCGRMLEQLRVAKPGSIYLQVK